MYHNAQLLCLSLIPSLIPPSNLCIEDIEGLIALICAAAAIPCSPDTDIRFRLFAGDNNSYSTRDVYLLFAHNIFQFHQITGETPESFLNFANVVSIPVVKEHRIFVLLFLIWLRCYPTYLFLAALFNVSYSTISKEIIKIIPYVYNKLHTFITWPSIREWRTFRGKFTKILTPLERLTVLPTKFTYHKTEPQQLFYSGHRCYHALYTQLIVDTAGTIRHVKVDFLDI